MFLSISTSSQASCLVLLVPQIFMLPIALVLTHGGLLPCMFCDFGYKRLSAIKTLLWELFMAWLEWNSSRKDSCLLLPACL